MNRFYCYYLINMSRWILKLILLEVCSTLLKTRTTNFSPWPEVGPFLYMFLPSEERQRSAFKRNQSLSFKTREFPERLSELQTASINSLVQSIANTSLTEGLCLKLLQCSRLKHHNLRPKHMMASGCAGSVLQVSNILEGQFFYSILNCTLVLVRITLRSVKIMDFNF